MIAPNREAMSELLTPPPQPIIRPELPPLPPQEVLDQLKEHSDRLETATPWQILEWAVKTYYPKLTMATAFGPEGCVILYMLSKIEPRVHVFNLDTGYQFQETLDLREIHEVADGTQPLGCAQQVTDRCAIRIAAGQGSEVVEFQRAPTFSDRGENDIGRVEPDTVHWPASTGEHRLKRNPPHIGPAQPVFDGGPDVRQILRSHGHGQRERNTESRAAGDGLPGRDPRDRRATHG